MKPVDPRWRRAASAKGIRRATAYGDEARGPQHPGHQQTDGLRQKDGAEVFAKARNGSALWAAIGPAEQTGRTQAVLEDRMKAGVWNAQVLLRELRKLGYQGGYTILKDWL